MKFYVNHSKYVYDVMHLGRIFFERVEMTNVHEDADWWIIVEKTQARIGAANREQLILSLTGDVKEDKWLVKQHLYEALAKASGKGSPYGILVGVRPVKLVHEFLDQGLSWQEIESKLSAFSVRRDKIDLLIEVAKKERTLAFEDFAAISLYIAIPFCPSICHYCSFPSSERSKKEKLVMPYVEALAKEIRHVGALVKEHQRRVDCIYIGGGTPSSLRLEELNILLSAIRESFDLSLVKEFSFEAGRPETITREKVDLLRTFGVDRICLNPQTMKDESLQLIGRDHTALEIRRVSSWLAQAGFKTINMDLIAGLPGESLGDFEETLQAIMTLDPENVTIHTLALKSSSTLSQDLESYDLPGGELVAQMVDYGRRVLANRGLTPYYMYRQKNMTGHFENIGYSKEGHESLYNIRIMEERHPILALGVGGISKKVVKKDLFHRIANFKGIEDYLERFDEVLSRKETFFTLDE